MMTPEQLDKAKELLEERRKIDAILAPPKVHRWPFEVEVTEKKIRAFGNSYYYDFRADGAVGTYIMSAIRLARDELNKELRRMGVQIPD